MNFFAFPYDFAVKDKILYAKYNFFEQMEKLAHVDQKAMIIKIFKEECQAIGGHLYHLFYHGFSKAISYLVPTPINGSITEFYDEDSVKDYILSKSGIGPAFISDHQPILTFLSYLQDIEFCS